MSEAPLRTKISGSLSLFSANGPCSVVVEDGTAKAAAARDPKGTAQSEELAKAKRDSFKQGFDDAQRKNASEIAALKVQLIEAKNQIPEALNAYLSDLEEQMRGEIVNLAFKAAEALTGAEIAKHDTTLGALRSALTPLLTTTGVKIHVAPSFLAQGVHTPPAGASFVSDPSLRAGEIMVDSQQGLIDGRIQSRLEALKGELLKELGKEDSNA